MASGLAASIAKMIACSFGSGSCSPGCGSGVRGPEPGPGPGGGGGGAADGVRKDCGADQALVIVPFEPLTRQKYAYPGSRFEASVADVVPDPERGTTTTAAGLPKEVPSSISKR